MCVSSEAVNVWKCFNQGDDEEHADGTSQLIKTHQQCSSPHPRATPQLQASYLKSIYKINVWADKDDVPSAADSEHRGPVSSTIKGSRHREAGLRRSPGMALLDWTREPPFPARGMIPQRVCWQLQRIR